MRIAHARLRTLVSQQHHTIAIVHAIDQYKFELHRIAPFSRLHILASTSTNERTGEPTNSKNVNGACFGVGEQDPRGAAYAQLHTLLPSLHKD